MQLHDNVTDPRAIKAFKTLLQRCTKIHGDKYAYDKVVYKNNSTKTEIICKVHGLFYQNMADHLSGKGCPVCAELSRIRKRSKTFEEFLQQCKSIHKNRYTYKNCVYTGIKKEVVITCRVHGDFTILADSFQRGQNCPICAHTKRIRTKTKSKELFVLQANKKHNNYYDYSKTIYRSGTTPITIICPEHGEYKQTPNAHLVGKCCTLCNKQAGGFKPTLDSYFYYLKVTSTDNTAYKVGITNHSIENRYSVKDRENIEILLFLKMSTGYEARKLETSIKRKYKKHQYEGPNMLKDGNTELFNIDILQYDSYRVELRAIELAISTTANKSAPITFDQAAKLITKVELATK